MGQIALDQRQAHHLRDVLRLSAGEPVELFDDAGSVAAGVIHSISSDHVIVEVQELSPPSEQVSFAVASAVPKGERADWMVEKLSEIGAAEYIPLISERSVVVPQGKNKLERWRRIATESAKQSRRRGVMRVAEAIPLNAALELVSESTSGWYFSTSVAAQPIHQLLPFRETGKLVLFIGPEGGWSESEIEQFERHGVVAVQLTTTILRVETAAIAAAAMVACSLGDSRGTSG